MSIVLQNPDRVLPAFCKKITAEFPSRQAFPSVHRKESLITAAVKDRGSHVVFVHTLLSDEPTRQMVR